MAEFRMFPQKSPAEFGQFAPKFGYLIKKLGQINYLNSNVTKQLFNHFRRCRQRSRRQHQARLVDT